MTDVEKVDLVNEDGEGVSDKCHCKICKSELVEELYRWNFGVEQYYRAPLRGQEDAEDFPTASICEFSRERRTTSARRRGTANFDVAIGASLDRFTISIGSDYTTRARTLPSCGSIRGGRIVATQSPNQPSDGSADAPASVLSASRVIRQAVHSSIGAAPNDR